jgi:hypothetical protein
MFSAPPVLLVDAIEKLEQLASALAETPDGATAAQTEALPSDRRLSKELLLSIRVLLPKLRSARGLQAPQPLPAAPYRSCASCEE